MKNIRLNRKMRIITIILFIIIGVISLAYAALSSTMTVTYNNVKQQALIWQVGFHEGNVSKTTTGSGSTTGLLCGNAYATATTVTVGNTSLSKPGDKCIWHLVVENKGDIDAKLSTIAATAPTGTDVSCTIASAKNQMTCGNIIYSLNTDDNGTLLTTTNTVVSKRASASSPGTLDVYLIAEYKSSVTSLTLTSNIVQSSAKFTLNFTQQ